MAWLSQHIFTRRSARIAASAAASVVCAVTLAACGLVPMMAQETAAAAIAPITNTARIIGYDLQLLSRTIGTSAAQGAVAARQISTSVNQASATANAMRQQAAAASAASRQMAYARAPVSRPRTSTQKATARAPAQQPVLAILPAETLKQLTPDQLGLQNAAQNEAFTAQVREMIFWDIEGRTGTAMAESESHLGSTVCRTFVQTVTIAGATEKGTAIACLDQDGMWRLSF